MRIGAISKITLLTVGSALIACPQCSVIQDSLYSLQSYSGTVSVSGSSVTRLTGQSFNSLATTFSIILNGTSYPIASITNGNLLTVTGSPSSSAGEPWTYNVPLAAGSTITLGLGYSPLPIIQSTAVVTVAATAPNVSICLPPATYTAAYTVMLSPSGTQNYARYWNVISSTGMLTITSYPNSPGVETPTPPNPNFTISLNQLAPLGPANAFFGMNSAGTGPQWIAPGFTGTKVAGACTIVVLNGQIQNITGC